MPWLLIETPWNREAECRDRLPPEIRAWLPEECRLVRDRHGRPLRMGAPRSILRGLLFADLTRAEWAIVGMIEGCHIMADSAGVPFTVPAEQITRWMTALLAETLERHRQATRMIRDAGMAWQAKGGKRRRPSRRLRKAAVAAEIRTYGAGLRAHIDKA